MMSSSSTPGRRRWRDDRGMVTAEAALVLPVLVVLLTFGLAALSAVTAQLRCVDAAREGARAAARGESSGTAVELAQRAAPAGARVSIQTTSERITVTVSADVTVAGGLLPAVPVQGTAATLPEPTGVLPPVEGFPSGGSP